MDPTSGISAAEWLARVDEKGLRQVLREFGEERFAGRIAKAIVARRVERPILRTQDLADIVRKAVPARQSRIDAATKTFQALRIQVNEELAQLEKALAASVDILRRGGRLCVISFHSLEDRRVKRFMRKESKVAEVWRGLPSIPADQRPPLRLVGKVVRPSADEIAANPRARSARLRIAERL
jgi:16S rRNA (cytosine1402-N4)-methyltransferase